MQSVRFKMQCKTEMVWFFQSCKTPLPDHQFKSTNQSKVGEKVHFASRRPWDKHHPATSVTIEPDKILLNSVSSVYKQRYAASCLFQLNKNCTSSTHYPKKAGWQRKLLHTYNFRVSRSQVIIFTKPLVLKSSTVICKNAVWTHLTLDADGRGIIGCDF